MLTKICTGIHKNILLYTSKDSSALLRKSSEAISGGGLPDEIGIKMKSTYILNLRDCAERDFRNGEGRVSSC